MISWFLQIKKTKRKQSVSILDEDDDDDEEFDEEEDDDDDDLMEDDLDDNDDEMDWEFETQDGNLIIADETPKKSTRKTPPSKKKGKKGFSLSFCQSILMCLCLSKGVKKWLKATKMLRVYCLISDENQSNSGAGKEKKGPVSYKSML